MNQSAIGTYINQKRKGKNLTQNQLAEKLRVSNKTVSKWENGKCMPDYSIIENLCEELDITIAELMDAEDTGKSNVRIYDEQQIVELIRRTQELENQKTMIYGVLLIVLGMTMFLFSRMLGGSNVRDFVSGVLLGISIGEALIGVYCIGRSFLR